LNIRIGVEEVVDFLDGFVHKVVDFKWAPLNVRVVFAEISNRIRMDRSRKTMDIDGFHFLGHFVLRG
jgi:hypothetical protein